MSSYYCAHLRFLSTTARKPNSVLSKLTSEDSLIRECFFSRRCHQNDSPSSCCHIILIFLVSRQWRLFIFISRESKWGTLKSAGNPRCAVPAESHSICTDWRRPGPAAALQVSPTSDTCQSVAILMNRPHLCVLFFLFFFR